MAWLHVAVVVLGVFAGYKMIDRFDPGELQLAHFGDRKSGIHMFRQVFLF